MRELARGPQRVAVGARLVFGDRRARRHRIADQAVVDEAELGDMRCLLEGGLDGGLVTQLPVAADVVRHVVEQLRRAGPDGFEHADHRRQDLVIDRQQFGRRIGLFRRLGDDDGDHVADEADLALRQHRERRLLHRHAIGIGDAPAARQRAQAVGLDVLAGQDGDHAGRCQRRTLVDAAQHGMAVRRTHEHARGHARPLDVGDVIAAAGQEALVFLALRCGTDPDHITHGHSPLPAFLPAFLPACMAAAPAITEMTMFW